MNKELSGYYNTTPRKLTHSQVLRRTLAMLKGHKTLTCCMIAFVILSSVSMMFIPYFIKGIVDSIKTISTLDAVLPLITVAVFGSLSTFISMIISTFLIEKIILDLRQKVVVHSLQQSMAYYNKEPLGRMVTRITKDLDEASNFYQTVSGEILRSIISLATVSTMLYILNRILLLFSLLGIPLMLVLMFFYRKRILTASQESRSQMSVVNTYLSEHLQGLLDLQLYNKSEESINNFLVHNKDLFRKEQRLGIYQMYIRPILNLSLIMMIASVVIAGAFMANKTLITVGTLFAFIQIIQSFFGPIINLAQVSAQIQTSMVSLERIFSFLDINTALQNPKEMQNIHAEIENPHAALRFTNVSFSYNSQKKVLQNINFELTPGKKTALVGHSGSGKTTISRLCMRFWDTSQGTICFNNIDIARIPIEILRTKIVLLEQDSFIFNDSLWMNISIGRDISREKMDAIAEKTGLKALIAKFEKGWDHVVNKNIISTGEQRLIAISRVLVDPPAIILLDEFSATLDNQTEMVIQSLLDELQQNRSSLIIAHRLNTIMQCDEILYIEKGRITEKGTHTELLARNGGYAELVKNMGDIEHTR